MLWVPKTDRFTADYDASLREQVFNITMAEIEAIVEPDGVGNDVGWESVTPINVHAPILAVSGS